jgi:signal transduction histidine kinase
MSLRLNEKLNSTTWKANVLFSHATLVNVWCRHFATSLPILEQCFLVCLDVGDLIYAGYTGFASVWLRLENGDPLDHVIEIARKHAVFARQSHNDVVHNVVRIAEQFAACMKGATRASTSFDDGTFDEAECVAALEKAGFSLGVASCHVMKQIAAFIHEQYAEALECAARAAKMAREMMATTNEGAHHFYLALTLAALYPRAPAETQREFARTLEEELQRHELWASSCPENFLNRHALVSAEVARVEGRALDAERLYEQAIGSARENGFVHNEALAYELASRFYRARGFDLFADTYLREARSCYARWGADRKVDQIDHRHPRLLQPRSLGAIATSTIRSEQLDLLSVTKASQTISGEIVLDKLLRTLLEVVLEQGGAQRGCLLLPRDRALFIEGEAAIEGGAMATRILESRPLSSCSAVPASIVNYVMRTKERVILDDAALAPKYASDPYIARVRPRSLLCLPILRQGEVVGLLYLENDLAAGAFTDARLGALELLASQAALAIDNARLYRDAQEAIRLRDDFISVASHELNTPLTSLMLSLQSLLKIPAERRLEPTTMDSFFQLMVRQGNRLTRLISELLDVSRIQADLLLLQLEDGVDLVEVVEEVVSRLRPDLERAACSLAVRGPAHVLGRWDRSRLEQVVTNLLSNAIKFGPRNPIEITIGEEAGFARVAITDHGRGIEPSQQQQLFGRFARGVSAEHYGGLGLGLYISRCIVAAHGGSIQVESQPGAGATFTVDIPRVPPAEKRG